MPASGPRPGPGWPAATWCLSVFAEHVGFSVWSLWSVFVLFLTPAYGLSADPRIAAGQKFLLTSVPTALGAAIRLPYASAVARLGGRTWTVISAALLLVPTAAAAAVLRPGASFPLLLGLAALAGVGGGNFASSMANVNVLYPDRLRGRALGLNAGGGNLGVAAVQLAGLAVAAAAGRDHPRLLLAVYLPLVVLAAAGAALGMDDIRPARPASGGALRAACRSPHTWVISVLYVGTFGSFIGFSFAFGQVLADQFGASFQTAGQVDPVKIASLTFLGPLIGSLTRPAGGWLADRLGGARVTLWTFGLMAAAAGLVLAASGRHSLPLFAAGFTALFAASGAGNGSVYKMIPAAFRDGDAAGGPGGATAGAVIGIAGAAGALGGVLVNIAFRQSFLARGSGDAAYLAFIAAYAACMALTWAVYARPGRRQ